jgi:hypothetical protein
VLRLLQSIFASRPVGDARYDPALIEAATAHVIDGTDPRLRSLAGFARRLRDPVERAVNHIMDLVDALPAPLELDADRYGTDSHLRAFFASREHLTEVVGSGRSLLEFVRAYRGPLPGHLFCGFGIEYEIRRVLGMEMQGEIMRRDVEQEVVNFTQHRLVAPGESEEDCRWEVKKRAFDDLIETALQRIVAMRSRRSELKRQHELLQRKLRLLNQGDFALGPVLGDETEEATDLGDLERGLAEVESQLLEIPTDDRSLDSAMGEIEAVFGHPEAHLWVTPVSFRLSSMGVRLEPGDPAAAIDIELREAANSRGLRRCFMLARIPTPRPRDTGDFLKEANRYLG